VKPEQAYLRHILDEIDFLLAEVATVTFEHFLSNETLTRACARSLEVIGEASKTSPTVSSNFTLKLIGADSLE
jgi:uncharacterized protein with HEPN domain